jgi:tRNA(adenine34) deaminase
MLGSDAIWDCVKAEAQRAFDANEVPVGAVITHQGKIIAATHNLTERNKCATAHAEMLAIHAASDALGQKYLYECDLFVSLEPCTMCAAALAHAKIRRIYYGAADAKGGACAHGVRFFEQPTCHHHPELYGGFHETYFAELLKKFFAAKRVL